MRPVFLKTLDSGIDHSTLLARTCGKGHIESSHKSYGISIACYTTQMQVILSGQARHSSPAPASGGSNGTAVGMSGDGTPVAVVAGGDQQLRIYHEYLSYVFRKPEAPSTHQQLEMGYRDYLQVIFLPPSPPLHPQLFRPGF